MPELVTRLARKWCAYCRGGRTSDPVNDHHYHGAVAAAIREALEEVEKMIQGHATRLAKTDPGKKGPTQETAGDVGLLVALAHEIASLREG